MTHIIWVQTMIHPRLSLYKCVAVLKSYDDYQKIAFSSVNTLLRSLETMNFYLFLLFIPYYLPEFLRLNRLFKNLRNIDSKPF